MGISEIIAIILSSSLSLYLLSTLFNFLHRVWWKPIRFQNLMSSHGIRGPSYRFIYGNSKETIRIRNESMSRPMKDLSHDIFPKIQPHIHSWINTCGVNFLYWVGPRAHLFVSEPELVREILNNKDKVYPKIEFPIYTKKLLGDGLVSSSGQKWFKMRKLANYAFHSESLRNMVPAMVDSVEMMLERWKNHEGNEIEVFEEFRLLTSEVISRTAFGSRYIEGKNIFDMLAKLANIISRNVFKVRLPGISKIFRSRDDVEAQKLENEIYTSILKIIQKREDKFMGGEAENFEDDFLGLLLKVYHEEDDQSSMRILIQDVIDECKTFYFAGQETTNVLLSWAILLLAIHTDWQEQARTEVLKFLGNQIPTADGIAKLKIMSMIFNETLRLYPPVVRFTRRTDREVQLGKLPLPADITLEMSSVLLHHDPNIWGEDVHLFKPERFSEGVAKATNNNTGVYLPFGLGPRSCVGVNFAITEAKIALSMILQRYSFTLSPAYVHSPVQLLTTRPQHGIQVILNALQSKS